MGITDLRRVAAVTFEANTALGKALQRMIDSGVKTSFAALRSAIMG